MHLVHLCPRFKEIHGGGEPVLLHLMNELAGLGIANTLCTPRIPNSMRDRLDPRVLVRQLPAGLCPQAANVLLQGFLDLIFPAFLALIPQKAVDVVCFHTEGAIPALLLRQFLFPGKPCLYFCFQPPRFAYDTSKESARSGGVLGNLVPLFAAIYRPLDRWAVRLADRVLTFSSDYKRWIEGIYSVDDVAVLAPGVEIPESSPPVPQQLRSKIRPGESKVIVFVGKLVAWKNVDRLLHITSLVARKVDSVKCLVVGDGPCMNPLRETVARLKLEDRVVFTGYAGPEQVFSYLKLADVFVLLEQNVSFGLSLVEANSCGLPVLAFEGGGPTDIIEDGKNGYLLPKDASDLYIADRITALLQDPAAQQEMSRYAKAASRNYTWKNFAEKFAAHAAELTAGPLGRSDSLRGQTKPPSLPDTTLQWGMTRSGNKFGRTEKPR